MLSTSEITEEDFETELAKQIIEQRAMMYESSSEGTFPCGNLVSQPSYLLESVDYNFDIEEDLCNGDKLFSPSSALESQAMEEDFTESLVKTEMNFVECDPWPTTTICMPCMSLGCISSFLIPQVT